MGLSSLLSACAFAPAPPRTPPPIGFALAPPAGEPSGSPRPTSASAVPTAAPAAAVVPANARPDEATAETAPHLASPSPTHQTAPGSEGGGSRNRPAPFRGLVLDPYGVPVAGAIVRFADGRSAETGADGAYAISPPPASGLVAVFAPGFATSVIHGLDAVPTLHLRRADGVSGAYDRHVRRVGGTVSWPDADHVGGVAFYEDTLGTAVQPAAVAADGSFGLEVTPARPGAARAAVLVLAEDVAGRPMIGVSAGFALAGDVQLPPVTLSRADREVAFRLDGVAAELAARASRLEVRPPDGPAIAVEGAPTLSGTFLVPAEGVTAAFRVVATARSPDGRRATEAGFSPTAGATAADALAVPEVEIDPAARRITWTAVPGARGYRVAVESPVAPRWEAWTGAAGAFEVPAESWPAPGAGDAVVEAVDAPDLAARHVASIGPRQLRIAPWEAAAEYRISRHRIPL